MNFSIPTSIYAKKITQNTLNDYKNVSISIDIGQLNSDIYLDIFIFEFETKSIIFFILKQTPTSCLFELNSCTEL